MPIFRSLPEVRPAGPEDHNALLYFLNREADVHRHLDWRAPLEWLGAQPFLVATFEQRIQAVLACPPDPPQTAWIRLFAARGHLEKQEYFEILLKAAQQSLLSAGADSQILAIGLQPWFQDILASCGFINPQSIVVLEWSADLPPELPARAGFEIRRMELADLPQVAELDAEAFEPVWNNSLETLSLAFQQSAYSTVAVNPDGIIGYQISTAIPMSGHLARLAVRPHLQREHVGYALVRELIVSFQKQSVWRVTVNTQDDNYASLALYQKMGFRRTGEVFPVFVLPKG